MGEFVGPRAVIGRFIAGPRAAMPEYSDDAVDESASESGQEDVEDVDTFARLEENASTDDSDDASSDKGAKKRKKRVSDEEEEEEEDDDDDGSDDEDEASDSDEDAESEEEDDDDVFTEAEDGDALPRAVEAPDVVSASEELSPPASQKFSEGVLSEIREWKRTGTFSCRTVTRRLEGYLRACRDDLKPFMNAKKLKVFRTTASGGGADPKLCVFTSVDATGEFRFEVRSGEVVGVPVVVNDRIKLASQFLFGLVRARDESWEFYRDKKPEEVAEAFTEWCGYLDSILRD